MSQYKNLIADLLGYKIFWEENLNSVGNTNPNQLILIAIGQNRAIESLQIL